jgi:hypothetical protein
MISHTTEHFRKLFSELPKKIQRQARTTYRQFKKEPYYPSLHFKRVHSTKAIYSVRITIDYRAVGIQNDNEIVWFWIGTHKEYEKLLYRL